MLRVHAQEERAQVVRQLNAVAAKLHGVITNNLSMISGLSAHVSINPDINQHEFERYVSAVFRQEPLLINMAAAPDMVVTMVHPLEANRGVLGLDYNKNADQNYAASYAVESKKMVVAGPVNLVQGGTAFIGRTATYDDKGAFWGLISAPIDEMRLYKAAGLLDPDLDINVAIRGKDGLGAAGDIFFGDAKLFDDLSLTRVSIDVGQGSWLLVGKTKIQDRSYLNAIWILRISSCVFFLLAVIFVYNRFQSAEKEKGYKEVLLHKASYDQLTGLPNRFLLGDRIKNAIAHASRTKSNIAVLFIDLDNFKPINDHFGHGAGDQVLREVAERIQLAIRNCDSAARYSGDEFVVILENISDTNAIATIAENVIGSINKPYEYAANTIYCGASVGISVYPEDAQEAESLLSKADQAMYEVKRSGRNGWHYFTEAMQVRSAKRHELYNKMVAAIDNKTLEVFYQPIVDLSNGEVVKCEALVRWFDGGELVPTADFIALAEDTGKINEVDRYVLEVATQFLNAQVEKYRKAVSLSINLSPKVFSNKDNSLGLWLALVLEASKKIQVTVEITERLLTRNTDQVLEILNLLKGNGITLAIDDFGTGYSSLSYLTKFPIDVLKIDQAFISQMRPGSKEGTLVEAIISLSDKLSLQVVAEGVETREQASLLQHWGCHYAQGYYFHKPMASADFTQVVFEDKTLTLV